MSTADEISRNLNSKIEEIRIKALKILEIEGLKSIRMNFQSEGRPERWLPRKPGTRYAARMAGHKILRGMTKRLFNMTVAVADYAESRVDIGNNLSYGRAIQEGNDKMPARPYLVIPNSDFPRIIKNIKRAVSK